MARDEIEEHCSEDLGFRLSTSKSGISLFETPVNFDTPVVSENNLQLLHVGHKKNLYAASNTQLVGIGHLGDLDEDETVIKEKLKTVSLADVTYVRFDSTNENLYVIAGGIPQIAAVATLMDGGASPFSKLGSDSNVSVLEPSPVDAGTYFYLDSENALHIFHNGSETSVPGIAGASWAYSGSEIVTVAGDTVRFFSLTGIETSSYTIEDAGNLYAVSTVDHDNWYVVGAPEDEEGDDAHTLVTRTGGNFSSGELFMPPAFGELPRAPSVYSASVIDWAKGSTFVFVANALSPEVATIECGAHTRLVVQSNDTDRAELPMDDDSGDDTLPVGFALDLSGTARTVKNPSPLIEEAVGILPRLLCLNNLGHLFTWHVFDVEGVRENKLDLNRAIAQLPGVSSPSKAIESIKKTEAPPPPAAAATRSITSNDFAKSLVSDLPAVELSGSGFGQSSQSSGFGATSFGNTKPGATPMFGANDFKAGSQNTSEQKPAKPAFGSTGFGGSALGSSGFGAPSFGATSFGNSANSTLGAGSGSGSGPSFGQASFGTQKTEKPFGGVPSGTSDTQTSAYSGFGSNSKFGALAQTGQNTSPFAGLKSDDKASPFAGLKSDDKASPFAGLKSDDKASPFAGLNSDDKASPFAGLNSDDKQSPFAGLKSDDKASPFAGLKSDDKASPFAGLKSEDNPSPFAGLKSQETPSPFGMGGFSQQKSVFSADARNDSDSDVSETESESPEDVNDSEGGSDDDDDDDDDDDSDQLEKATFAKMNLTKTTNASLAFGQFNRTPAQDPSTLEKKSTLGGIYGNPKGGQGISLNDSSNGFSKSTNLGPSQATTTSGTATPKLGGLSLNSDNSVKEQSKADEKSAQQPVKAEVRPPKKEEVSYVGKDIAEVVKKIEFLKLGGFSEKPASSDDEIAAKSTELVQFAQGELDVLALNTEKVRALMDAAGIHRKDLSGDDLSVSALWALGDLDDLRKLTTQPREKLDEILMLVKHQDTKLSKLLRSVDEAEEKKEDVEKVVTQLALFKQSLESAKLSKRPLDVRAEMLRHRLRKKLAHVELLQEDIAHKLLPFGVRLDLGQSAVARVEKLEKVVHEVSMKARELSNYVAGLEQEVEQYCGAAQIDGSTDHQLMICPAKAAPADKFDLAKKFANAKQPRKIKPLVI
ncbi:hypothetical protein JCM33374_g4212 [Metschnikowia sp. JCM 33374]|nr:hypothetical protein JCM33374_g4212 [Metschnikowia sp. JCM 33374]